MLVSLLLHVGASHFVECLLGICALREVVDEAFECLNLSGVVFAEALSDCTTIECVVALRIVCLGSLAVILLGCCVRPVVEMAVAYAVVCVRTQCLLACRCLLQETVKVCHRLAIFLCLEICVSKAVECVCAVVASYRHCCLVAACCRRVVVERIVGLASPIECVIVCLLVVRREFNRAIHKVYRALQVFVDERLNTQTVEYLLLRLEDCARGAANLFNRAQCNVVVACVHVHLYKILAHLCGVGRIGVFVQETLEYRNALGKGRVACLVDTQCIVVESLLAYAAVVVGVSCLLERETRLCKVVEVQLYDTHVKVGILSDCVALAC